LANQRAGTRIRLRNGRIRLAELHWYEAHGIGKKELKRTVLLLFPRRTTRTVHVQHADGEAKFWIEPTVELAANFGLKPQQITEVQHLIEEHLNEIRAAWAKHFPSGSD
jgi:hypothetical protein